MCLPEYRYTYSVWGSPFQMGPYLSLNIFEYTYFFSKAHFLTDAGTQRCYLLHSSLHTAKGLPKQELAVQPDVGTVAYSLDQCYQKSIILLNLVFRIC